MQIEFTVYPFVYGSDVYSHSHLGSVGARHQARLVAGRAGAEASSRFA